MGIGSTVRRLCGRHEQTIAELYRSIYVDLDAYADQVASWVPQPRRILEVGCGEGAVTTRLARRYPAADILAIDITPKVGRLFDGCRDRVSFVETTVEAVAEAQPAAFDLVVISDVIHHVPQDLRIGLLTAARRATAAKGFVVFKDWARAASPIHWMVHGSDRWITGDRVHYLSKRQADAMMAQVFGAQAVVAGARIAPWSNNFALLARMA